MGGAKTKVAHRVMYALAKGPIEEGLVLDHLCRVPGCINPEHLEAVTQKVNVRRGNLGWATKLRFSKKTCCGRGHVYDVNDNLRFTVKGHRACRICARAYRNASKARCGRVVRMN